MNPMLKSLLWLWVRKGFGSRCETEDYDDLPDLHEVNCCFTCNAWRCYDFLTGRTADEETIACRRYKFSEYWDEDKD